MALIPVSKNTWLVKSSGMILGPYTLEEVIQNLEEKRIAIIDEVRGPDSRWSFIREHKQFTKIVQFLREQETLLKEDTGKTQAGTKTFTDSHTDDITLTPVNDRFPPPGPAATGNAIKGAPPPPTYAFQADQKVQKSLQQSGRKFSLLAWMALLAVVVLLSALIISYRGDLHRSLGFEDYLRLARSNKTVGQFEKSLEFFRKAESLKPLEPSSRLQMIPLMMLVENQNVQARQLLEQIPVSDRDPQIRDEVENLMALSYLREGHLDEAQKRYVLLLQKDNKNESAKMNLVEISILRGEFESAYQGLTDLMKDGVKDLSLVLYRALTSYRNADAKKNDEKLESTLADLKRYWTKTQDFKPESILLAAAIEKKLGRPADEEKTLREILNTNPDLTREHVHDIKIHREILEWNYLGNICQIIDKDSAATAVYLGLEAYCAYQRSDMKTALESIDKARKQFSSEPILYGLQAFLLFKSGRTAEASALFQLPRADDSDLLTSTHGSICLESKDWGCAEAQWKKLQQTQPKSVDAYYGLAKVALEKGKKEMAMDLVTQGLLVSANYRPLTILKEELDGL